MNNLIKWNEEWIYMFTKHSVDKIKETEWFNRNHIAKALVWHIDVTFAIIDNLLSNENKTK